ncbi:MAG: DNA polymerase III subunit beta [Deltaproteobacteria bacterium]|nr:DNA polymerase III subunit beta [Deltaproteobacteria bacterium]
MRVVIDKQALATMTSRVQGALGDKNFAHIVMEANQTTDGGQLQLVVRDRVMAIYCEESCQVEREGKSFVPAKLFSDMVRELPAGSVTLFVEGSKLVVSAGGKNEFLMKLPLLDNVEDLRGPKHGATQESLEIPSAKLAYMIDQIQFCVSQESPRNYGTVAFLHRPSGNKLRIVGTDGFRLSFCEADIEMPAGFLVGSGICISKRGVTELGRMCNEGYETISLTISDDRNTLVAIVRGYKLISLLSTLNFPNYQGVVPDFEPSMINVHCQSLQSVAKRVLLAADKTKTLKLNLKKGSMTLSSRDVGNSEGYETIPLEEYSGPAGAFSINGKFLTDVISATMSEMINIRFNDDNSPVLMIPTAEPAECRSQHVLVPIKESN